MWTWALHSLPRGSLWPWATTLPARSTAVGETGGFLGKPETTWKGPRNSLSSFSVTSFKSRGDLCVCERTTVKFKAREFLTGWVSQTYLLGMASVCSWILIFCHALGSSHKELCRWDRQRGRPKQMAYLLGWICLKANPFPYPSEWGKLRILIGNIG